MPSTQWTGIGSVEEPRMKPLQEVSPGKTTIVLTYKDGSFAAISGVCNHVGGSLGEGTFDDDYAVCPGHHWKFDRQTGQGAPGYEQDRVPAYATSVEKGRLYIDLPSATKRKKQTHQPHPFARPVVRQAGSIRVGGATAMIMEHPRYSTSDAMLKMARSRARRALKMETQCLKLSELNFAPVKGLFKIGPGLSLALFDRSDGSNGPARS